MVKIEELEGKIQAAVQLLASLKKENADLRREIESLQSNLSLFKNENSKAQKILADYDQKHKNHAAATQKIERALAALNALRGAS